MSADNTSIGLVGSTTTQGGRVGPPPVFPTPIPAMSFTNQIATCTAADNAFILSANHQLGRIYEIRNDGASYAQIFPPVGVQINAYGANAPAFIGVGAVLKLVAQTSTQWYTMGYTGPQPVISVAANQVFTLGSNYSDCILSLGSQAAGALTINLPAPAQGLRYRFVQRVTNATNTCTIAATGAICQMHAINEDVTAQTTPFVANRTNLILAATAPVGTYAEYICDGTSWYVTAVSRVHDTVTQS